MGETTRTTIPALALSAAAVFALAFFSPLELVDSDPAMALVASQALLDHGTLDLDVYRDHPDFAYEFDVYNYRVKRFFGGHYYFNLGLPVVAVPIVWTANRLGYHMLDQDDEFAVQNLTSAVLTALVFLLVYRLARFFLRPWPALAVAGVSTLGSSLVSTLATGLWSADFQVALVAWILVALLRRGEAPLDPRSCAFLAALLAAAFVIRPTTAFLGVAFLVFLLGEKHRLVTLGARLALGAAAALLVLAAFELLPWLPRYYSPRRILLARPEIWTGLYGTLLSPSRGLLVFCPFLIPVVAAAALRWRALWGHRVLRMIVLWIALHLAGVSLKTVWWGGQCFGPRLLTELVPGFVVLTAWAWREIAAAGSPRRRVAWAAPYLVLGLAAVFVHSYQGLFNPATQRWSSFPNVDDPRYAGLLFDWRHPQFLATDAALEERFVEIQRRGLGVCRLGEELAFDSPDLLFVRWYQAEEGWRWSRGTRPEIVFRLAAAGAGRAAVLELHASSQGPQSVALAANGVALGGLRFAGSEVLRRPLMVGAGVLRAGENTLELEIPGARRTPADERVLGLALRSLRLRPLTEGFAVTFRDDAFFAAGFAAAEEGWRWSDGTAARVLYPVAEVATETTYELLLEAGAYGGQRIEILVGGVAVGEVELQGAEPRVIRRSFPGTLLGRGRLNTIEFRIPGAQSPPGDPRLLGLRFLSLSIRPA